MSQHQTSVAAGWYRAEGDPPDTVRFWDGSVWTDRIEDDPASYLDGAPLSRDQAIRMNPAAASLFDVASAGYPVLEDSEPRQFEELSIFDLYYRAMTTRFADGSHRARRSELATYLIFQATLIFLSLVAVVWATTNSTDSAKGLWQFAWFVGVAVLVTPTTTVIVRRLHDLNVGGGWALLLLIPWLNLVFFLVLLFGNSHRGTNQWGPAPKYVR